MKRTEKPGMTPAALAAAAKGDLHNAITAATPGGIEAQEKAGQALLVASSNVPKSMYPSREAFEKLGFKFGKDVDELFVNAELPPGWFRAATSHSMHSDIVDEQGRKRVGVFYKAAFYDRRADATLVRRYVISGLYSGDDGAGNISDDEVIVTVTDAGKEIHRWPPCSRQNQFDGPRKLAEAWLKERFPDADDPTSYWT